MILATVDRLRALPPPLARDSLRQLEAELGPEAGGALGTSWEFFGRPAQLELLRRAFRGLLHGIVCITGGYGTGKTRAAWELLIFLILIGRAKAPRIIAKNGAAARKIVENKLSGILAWKKPGVSYDPQLSKGYEGQLGINGITIDLLSVDSPMNALGDGTDVQLLDDPPKWEATGRAALIAALKSARERGTVTIIPTTKDGLALVADVNGVHVDNLASAGVLVIDLGTTEANATNLDESHFVTKENMERAGTWDPDASRSPWASIRFDKLHLRACPPLVEIAVSIDPNRGGSSKPCEVGIVGGGRDARDVLHVLHDRSAVLDGGAEGWPKVAWDLAEEMHAEHPCAPFPAFVLESNVGKVYMELLYGEERIRRKTSVGVANNLRCNHIFVKADRDKCVRSEAPAAEAGRGRVRFAEDLHVLEGQLRNLAPKGTDSDRADAANHLLTFLGKLESGPEQAEQARDAEQARAAFAGLRQAQARIPAPSFGGERL